MPRKQNMAGSTSLEGHEFGSFHSAFGSEASSPESSPQHGRGQALAMAMAAAAARRVTNRGGDGGGCGQDNEVGGERRPRATESPALKTAEFGLRVLEVALCLISLSVMVADQTQGWSGDSFNRYWEFRILIPTYRILSRRVSWEATLGLLFRLLSSPIFLLHRRYCLAVTIIGFAYSGLQACALAVHIVVGKRLISNHPRHLLEFAMDQTVAYLLISASSAAATRAEDWVSNWGKDEFTQKASASIAMSFLAFAAFSLTSIISASHIFS
ncbi:CASP-like protein 4A3 isoform X1 [Diospyros lotus]|uniref:CASP-like protein 4A3 isoform X1 n=1 Tax=Diospyros lotus TaxID=55363 RepID=UPI00224D1EE8|nr:CASP-like protein 4A3 isoform X1 [Diospyros lotus]